MTRVPFLFHSYAPILISESRRSVQRLPGVSCALWDTVFLCFYQKPTGYEILFDNVKAIARTKGYFPRKYGGTAGTPKHLNKIIQRIGYQLNAIWNILCPFFV